jgi:very-short-patch-repair endonuclease
MLVRGNLPSKIKQMLLNEAGITSTVVSSIAEHDIIAVLKASFQDQDPVQQFRVGTYRIDLYLRKANLSVECDEHNHKHYDQVEEAIRTNYISQKLNCAWIRFNPFSEQFNVGDVVYRIRYAITGKLI